MKSFSAFRFLPPSSLDTRPSRHSLCAPHSAILLLGPTGSGKTPLGDCFMKKGFCGHRCAHFDFGENLRETAGKKKKPSFLSVADFNTVRNVLESGALLSESEFHIAGNILHDFIRRKKIKRDDVIVLNGLPRHEGQARAIEAIVQVNLVINLRCRPEVVLSRIRMNSGGDRLGRKDDSLMLIRRKLRLFKAKTLPLLDHYRAKGVKVININVEKDAVPAEIVSELEKSANTRRGWKSLNCGRLDACNDITG